MAKSKHITKEIKGLGTDLVRAFLVAKKSKEFKKVEKELGSAIKSVAASFAMALKAAKESKETAKIKSRVKNVVKAGTAEGKIQARKAEVMAVEKIKKAAAALKQMAKKYKN